MTRSRPSLWLGLLGVVLYAQWGTGLATDDFTFLRIVSSGSIRDFWPRIYVSTPLLQATHALPYYLFGDHAWAYGPLKAAYLMFGAYAAGRFFALFVDPWRSWIGAVLLFLTPLHDGATLWFAGQYLTLSLAFYLLAYVYARRDQGKTAMALAFCGSFTSYGSPPIAAGLAVMCALRKRWREAGWLLIPNVVYVAYYVYTSAVLNLGTARLPQVFDLAQLSRSFAAQVATFADAGLGPSAWLKYALSLGSLTWESGLLALVAGVWLWRVSRRQTPPDAGEADRRLLLAGCGAVTIAGLSLFALTGAYPQVAFSLGDRVAIFGNLFLVAVAISVLGRTPLTLLAIVTVTAFLGLSDHWRHWNATLTASRRDVRALDLPHETDRPLFVRGLQYSRLGPIAHIDHFTATYVVRDFFAIARGGPVRVVSFNARLRPDGSELVDVKDGQRTAFGESILLYDADQHRLTDVPRADIDRTLHNERVELRHWTQLLGPGLIRDIILRVMPHLKYAYGA